MPEIDRVNAVLATFTAGHRLFRDARSTLRLSTPWGDTPVRLRTSDRRWLSSHRRFRYGGTTEQALCQLVLWLRNQPRVPLAWWRYVCSEPIGLGTTNTVPLLECYGYGDEQTRCVLCGAEEAHDWWSLGKVIGPCCSFGRCRKERSDHA